MSRAGRKLGVVGVLALLGVLGACKIEARHELSLQEAGHKPRFVEPLPLIPDALDDLDSSAVAGMHRSALALELAATRAPLSGSHEWLETSALERAQDRLAAVGASPFGQAGGWWQAGAEEVEVRRLVSNTFRLHWQDTDIALPADALRLVASPPEWQGPVEAIHVGGGVTEPDLEIDDYAGLDVAGHLVIIDQAMSADANGRDRSIEYLVNRALTAGATGCILLSDGHEDRTDDVDLDLASEHEPLVAVIQGHYAAELHLRGLQKGARVRVGGRVVSRHEERTYRHLVARFVGLEHPERATLVVVLPPRRLDRRGARRFGRALSMLAGIAGQWRRTDRRSREHSLVLLALDPIRGDRTNLGELLAELRMPPESLVGVVTIDGIGFQSSHSTELVMSGDHRVWDRAARRFAPSLQVRTGPGPARRVQETLEGLRALGIPTISVSVPGSEAAPPTVESAALSPVGFALEAVLEELDHAPQVPEDGPAPEPEPEPEP